MRVKHRLSIDALSERLGLLRSTIYYWVRDLPIPGSGSGGGWPTSAQRLGTRAMQRKYQRLREAAYAQGLGAPAQVEQRPTRWTVLALPVRRDHCRGQRHAASSAHAAWMEPIRDEWH